LRKEGKMSENKSQIEIGIEAFEFTKYVQKQRWNSFYHQIHEVIRQEPESVLEIGVGTGILKTMLKSYLKLNYEALDANPNTNPDYVGTVLKMPFMDENYDVVCCFQVLEHLPFEDFEKALAEIFRVAKKAVILSLPNDEKMLKIQVTHFWRGLSFRCPFFLNSSKIRNKNHYWEINKKGYEAKKIIKLIQKIATKHSFFVEKEFRDTDNTYHHFFVLKKEK